jgi:hypothetical protein
MSANRDAPTLIRAQCQCCDRQSRPVQPDAVGEPDLWRMARGWSQAPFSPDFKHSDGRTGSLYTCPSCNTKLRAGLTLQRRPVGVTFTFLRSA